MSNNQVLRPDFFREPDNPYDPKAIVIKNAEGAKIGYVTKADNVIFLRLMDAGKLLFGRIASKEMKGNWLKSRLKYICTSNCIFGKFTSDKNFNGISMLVVSVLRRLSRYITPLA